MVKIAVRLLALCLVWTPVVLADGATVMKSNGPCSMPGADANGNLIFGGSGQATTQVENDNKVLLKCVGTGIANLSGRAQSFDGFECGIMIPNGEFVLTTNSHATVSADGSGTVTCTVTKP
jgi:hypothetical protein